MVLRAKHESSIYSPGAGVVVDVDRYGMYRTVTLKTSAVTKKTSPYSNAGVDTLHYVLGNFADINVSIGDTVNSNTELGLTGKEHFVTVQLIGKPTDEVAHRRYNPSYLFDFDKPTTVAFKHIQNDQTGYATLPDSLLRVAAFPARFYGDTSYVNSTGIVNLARFQVYYSVPTIIPLDSLRIGDEVYLQVVEDSSSYVARYQTVSSPHQKTLMRKLNSMQFDAETETELSSTLSTMMKEYVFPLGDDVRRVGNVAAALIPQGNNYQVAVDSLNFVRVRHMDDPPHLTVTRTNQKILVMINVPITGIENHQRWFYPLATHTTDHIIVQVYVRRGTTSRPIHFVSI